jgi:dihydrodiol dehydrogenase / D-xylose 1-dehydrogenase (NADP)
MPDEIKVTGQIDRSTDVVLQAAVAMSFPSTGSIAPVHDETNTNENTPKLPGTGVALLSLGFLGESEESTTVVGTKGRLKIETPSHCPTTLSVRIKEHGRGQSSTSTTYHYPLPADTEQIMSTGGYYYPNSAGFAYEAAAVARCIAAGKTECPQYTLNETLVQIKIMDQIRTQLGCKSIYED